MWVLNHREGWMLKNLRFELWCWRRLLRNPWTARRSNQSVLKEINPEYSLDGLMLKLKLQYFGTWLEEPVHSKKPWHWKRLKAKREGDNRRWLDGINDSMDISLSKFGRWWRTGKPGVFANSQTRLSDWTTAH